MMKDPQAIKPRRPHNKSRLGCAQCKLRKIKCDETKPTCQKCTNHGQQCSFLQTNPQAITSKRGPPTISSMLSPESNPSTPTSSTSDSQPRDPKFAPQFSILDMELLHSWSTRSSVNYVDFPESIELFKVTVVELAFTYRFLMHEILALSALHLSLLSSNPSEKAKYAHASSSHLASALALFQPEIAKLTPINCHACLAFSTLVFTHSWAAQDISKPSALLFVPKSPRAVDGENVQWVKLHKGTFNIIQSLLYNLQNGPLGALFSPWAGLDPDRADPLVEVEERQLNLLHSAWRNDDCMLSFADKEVLDLMFHNLTRVFSMMQFNLEISKLSTVMTWFSWLSDEYLKMLEAKIPEALLLVIFYCVALKRSAYMWWLEGKAENLLRTVVVELPAGKRWESYLRWPVEQVLGGGEVIGFDGERINVDRLAVSNIMNVD